jgi:tetratricopeptide (TPR) repeat protein
LKPRLAAALLVPILLLMAPSPLQAIEALEARTRSFRLLTEGIQAVEAGRYAEAVEKLEKVTGISLNSFQGYYYLGRAYNGVRRYEDAIQAFEVALELEPTHLQSRIGLADAYLRSGALREASVEYHRSLELQPQYAPSFDGLGRLAEAQGKDDEAEDLFRRAIKVNPGFPDAYLHLGDLYLSQGEVDDAVDLFLGAIAVRPDFADAYNRLGAAYAEQRLFDEAMAAIGKARSLNPYDAAHPLALGRVLMELDMEERAEQEFLTAIELDPDRLEAYLRLAERHREGRDWDLALDVLRTGDARPVDDPIWRRKLDEALDQYRKERARLLMMEEKLINGEPLTLDEALVLSRIYNDLDDARAAADLLGNTIANMRVETSVRFELGYYQLLAGRFNQAEEIFSFLAEIDPRDTAALLNKGIAAAAQGRLGVAASAYGQALMVDPRLKAALLYLGNVYVRQGEKAKAVEAYRQFLQIQGGREHVERVQRILEMLEGES